MKTRYCIHNCGNVIKPGSKLNECTSCRHAYYYWKRKRPAQVITRRAKLDVYASRLDEHFETKAKNANVLPFRRRA